MNKTNFTPKRRHVTFLPLLPVIIFLITAGFFFAQLTSGNDNSDIPSALIGKPLPAFSLPAVPGLNTPGFSHESAQANNVTLINVWASWCAPCRAEHPFVKALAERQDITVYGLNYKDRDENAAKFLEELGNPYNAIGADYDGRIGIDLGVYGVPETFVVDQDGTIQHKFIGPITASRLTDQLLPAIERVLAATDAQ